MHTDLRAYVKRAEDGKILLSFLNDPAICVHKIEYDGKQLELMSYQLICAFLAKVGIERANFSINEAKEITHKTILSYKSAFVSAEDVKRNYHYRAFTRAEFNLLYHYFLVMYCKVDPFEALEAKEDDAFWHQFFPDAEPYNPSLPKLYGNPDDVERAKLIQRRQVSDLRILKEGINNWVGPIIRKMAEEALDRDKADSILTGYQLIKESLIAYIDSIIQRPRADDWLSTENLFKYNTEWLNNIQNKIGDGIDHWKEEVNYIPPERQLKYPVLSCNGWAAIEVDLQSTDWQVRIVNHKLSNIFALKLGGELEVLELGLVMFFLMSLGVKISQMEPSKICKLAEKTTDLWRDKLKLKRHNVYTKNELFNISQHYLEECCNCFLPKELLIDYNDKFWRLFFPDTKPFYSFLPKLIGEAEEIAQAELIRSRQVHHLLNLLDAVDLNGQWNGIVVKEDQTLPINKNHLTNYISEIINRNQAKDWITTESVTHDLAWLRHEMAGHNFIFPKILIDVQLGK